MLKLSKVYKAIEAKRSLIENFGLQNSNHLSQLIESCEQLASIDHDEFNQKLLSFEDKFPAALATEELVEKGLVFESLEKQLSSIEETNIWKKQILENRVVFAADGSQIEPDKNLNMFFGAVQAGWFLNYHDPAKKPIKDVDFELVLPSEMFDEEDELRQKIAFERFTKEARVLMDLIEKVSKLENKKTSIGFFDGSLTISFVHNKTLKKKYLEVVSALVRKSQECKVPILGYIDTSLASNLTKTLEVVLGSSNLAKTKINDASLLKSFMSKWGDRSAYFRYFDETSSVESSALSEIGFCYLKSSSKKVKPSRIEIPHWVYKEGLIGEVINVVLAECLVGNGYPYPIEVADSVAVIRNDEKEVFYEAIQKSLGSGLDLSNKLKSKYVRRRSSVVV